MDDFEITEAEYDIIKMIRKDPSLADPLDLDAGYCPRCKAIQYAEVVEHESKEDPELADAPYTVWYCSECKGEI